MFPPDDGDDDDGGGPQHPPSALVNMSRTIEETRPSKGSERPNSISGTVSARFLDRSTLISSITGRSSQRTGRTSSSASVSSTRRSVIAALVAEEDSDDDGSNFGGGGAGGGGAAVSASQSLEQAVNKLSCRISALRSTFMTQRQDLEEMENIPPPPNINGTAGGRRTSRAESIASTTASVLRRADGKPACSLTCLSVFIILGNFFSTWAYFGLFWDVGLGSFPLCPISRSAILHNRAIEEKKNNAAVLLETVGTGSATERTESGTAVVAPHAPVLAAENDGGTTQSTSASTSVPATAETPDLQIPDWQASIFLKELPFYVAAMTWIGLYHAVFWNEGLGSTGMRSFVWVLVLLWTMTTWHYLKQEDAREDAKMINGACHGAWLLLVTATFYPAPRTWERLRTYVLGSFSFVVYGSAQYLFIFGPQGVLTILISIDRRKEEEPMKALLMQSVLLIFTFQLWLPISENFLARCMLPLVHSNLKEDPAYDPRTAGGERAHRAYMFRVKWWSYSYWDMWKAGITRMLLLRTIHVNSG